MSRKLASIQRIEEIIPIENADKICQYRIGGWKVVDQKDKYAVGDLVIYVEVDSWVPHSVAPFLSKNKEPRVYENIKGERLKTIRLRGALSQGLILPMHILDNFDTEENVWHWATDMYQEDEDVSEYLGIIKWDRPIPVQLQGQIKGNFPSCVKKTDQERIQNMSKTFVEWINDADFEPNFVIEEKLDGTSFTCLIDPSSDEFTVCSRNMNLKEMEENAYWRIARSNGLEEILRKDDQKGFAIQGEIVGPSIQKNLYKLDEPTLYVFDVWDIDKQSYLSQAERREFCKANGLKSVPTLNFISEHSDLVFVESKEEIPSFIEWCLTMAEGTSVLNNKVQREGLVFKNLKDPNLSFKAISNKYLLGGGE